MLSILSAAPAADGTTPENPLMSLLPFAFIFIIFYFLIIRPQQKKIKEQQATISAIKKGDKVVLSSGIIGKVTKVAGEDGILEAEIADGVVVKVISATIASVEAKDKPLNDNKKK